MEKKLAEYRASKAKEKQIENSFINRIKNSFMKIKGLGLGEPRPKLVIEEDATKKSIKQETNTSVHERKNIVQCNDKNFNFEHLKDEKRTKLYWILQISKLLLWIVMWAIFIELQFGAVYFTISLILFIYLNTRTGPKDDKMSAYSVFNKDCERIHGTVTAEQLQKSMFGVPGLST